jgi:hypothetical protein
MDGASDYRERAEHLRRLAEMTWQRDLEGVVRSLAQDYEEIAEDLEAGATEVRHPRAAWRVGFRSRSRRFLAGSCWERSILRFRTCCLRREHSASARPSRRCTCSSREAALGLPPNFHSYALLPIGYPIGRFGLVRRVPLADVAFEDRWAEPYRDP